MRVSPNQLDSIKGDLHRFPSKIGSALLAEYEVEAKKLDAAFAKKEPDYDYCFDLTGRVHSYAKRLKDWYRETIEERESRKRK